MKVKEIPIDGEVDVYRLELCTLMRDCMEEEELNDIINKMLDNRLTYREREIIKLRFFNIKLTRKEIGKIFNVNGERIRQVEMKALHKLSKMEVLESYFNKK